MRVSKTIKKIVALGVGATMMGATLMGATAAADLKDYPNFFLDGGTFDGLIVVGAGGPDSLAAVDISANMFYAGSSGSKTTTTVSGDAWKVGTSSKKIEMSNSNASGTSLQAENIRNINTFIGDDELGALGDGEWKTNEKNYPYQQFLFFDIPDQTSGIVKYDESDDDVTADFFAVKNAVQIARYKVEFTTVAETDVTDSSGAADTTGLYLDDFENTDLTLWGSAYNVVKARRSSSTTTGGNNVLITLMAGPVRDTLLEGESGTYDLEGEEFAVELSFVDSDEAKFLVNGEATNKLKDGDTYTLKSGKEIGVSEILYQDYAGGVHSATFYLGARKIELRDDNIIGTGSSHDMVLGSETIDGAAVIITGTNDNTTLTISTIEVNMTAEDDVWVGAGEKLSDAIASAGEEKEVLFANAWDMEYKGLSGEETHDIRLKSSSSRRYKLQVYDGDGNAVDLPVSYADNATGLVFGEDSWAGTRTNQKRLIFSEGVLNGVGNTEMVYVHKDDYFVLTGGTAADGTGKSYLLQYKGQDNTGKTSPKIKFKNVGSGETIEYSVTAGNATATIKIGGYSFNVNGHNTATDDQPILVDLDGSGAQAAATNVSFVDFYGSQWAFTLQNASGTGLAATDFNGWASVGLNQTTPDADDYDNQPPNNLNLAITATTGPEVRTTLSGFTLVTPDGETEVSYGYSSMGSFFKFEEPSSDPDELTMTYPKEQRLPELFVTAGAVSASTTVTGGTGTRVAVPITATKLHTEVANVAAQNIITVGGPCANSVTAEVMYAQQGLDVPTNCAEGFTEGEGIISLYDVGSNVAMVVAGYSGDDTRRAGKVLAARVSELSGKKVVVQGTTINNAEIVKVE